MRILSTLLVYPYLIQGTNWGPVYELKHRVHCSTYEHSGWQVSRAPHKKTSDYRGSCHTPSYLLPYTSSLSMSGFATKCVPIVSLGGGERTLLIIQTKRWGCGVLNVQSSVPGLNLDWHITQLPLDVEVRYDYWVAVNRCSCALEKETVGYNNRFWWMQSVGIEPCTRLRFHICFNTHGMSLFYRHWLWRELDGTTSM